VVGVGIAGLVLALSVALTLRSSSRVRVEASRGPLPAPAEGDRGEACADVGDRRVCWGPGLSGAGCSDGMCVVERTVPAGVAAPAGWRCDGRGASRVCEERVHDGSAFVCDGGTCAQADPRMPDEGEWECVDIDGIVYCHATAHASGTAPGPADLGWKCGQRRGAPPGERVCVDLSPDRPDAKGWRCKYEYVSFYARRVCAHEGASSVGGRCSGTSADACPRDARCVGGLCVPPRPTPDCWLDKDCGDGARCRWGSCTGGGA